MNQYLLLRNNKQTGPYSAEELAAKGLKAYDLVWVEGRSAAWRYPSEIEELKPFAPVVEEQPYDRFYKKPSEQNTASAQTIAENKIPVQETIHTAMAGTEPENAHNAKPVAGVAPKEHNHAKHIYVTMPVSKNQTAVAATPVAKKEEPKPGTQYNTSQQPYNNNYNTSSSAAGKTQEKKTVASSSYIVSKEDDELNSSMLAGYQARKKEDEEINSGYLSDYEARKAAFSSNKPGASSSTSIKQAETIAASKIESWSPKKRDAIDLKALLAGSQRYLQDNKNVTRALVAALLILGGVVIGLVINSGRRHPDTKALESLVKEIREQQNEKSAAVQPATGTARKEDEKKDEPAYTEDNAITDPAPPAAVHGNGQPELRQAVMKKENNNTATSQNKQPVAMPASNTNAEPVEPAQTEVVEKEKTITREMAEKARKNIYDMVRLEASAFHVGLLGGISDLDITVINSSLYPLDQVAVEIRYFGPEKKLVKTQTLMFNQVPAGKRRTLEAPRTNRGISIDYTITNINSKAIGLAQAGY